MSRAGKVPVAIVWLGVGIGLSVGRLGGPLLSAQGANGGGAVSHIWLTLSSSKCHLPRAVASTETSLTQKLTSARTPT